MHQAFNFPFLVTRWDGEKMREVINDSLSAFHEVGAPSTWVLSNHDQVRHATRLALDPAARTADRITGIGPLTTPKPDAALGLHRARAATTMMLALPGVAYVYQGEELGLPEAVDIPDEYRQDPTFFRTAGEQYGRDGCRVPIPWEAAQPSYGFGDSGLSWLPQPEVYRVFSRDLQEGVEGSTLELYKKLLRLRKELQLGTGTFAWIEGTPENVLGFTNNGVSVFINYSTEDFVVPAGEILVDSGESASSVLAPNTAVWLG
jgi:alpha-glucosidase